MSPDLVDAILAKVRATWVVANDLEVTLEANPTSVEAGRFRAFRGGGGEPRVGRHPGARDRDLKALGRMHSVAEARAAFDVARSTFDRVSFDLIYARQDQALEGLAVGAFRGAGDGRDHLSLYQLTIEDGTAFGDRFRRGRLGGLPDEDLAADMYLLTQEMTGRRVCRPTRFRTTRGRARISAQPDLLALGRLGGDRARSAWAADARG
jgi:coproporphyrinogen III oxidase-like Fe-S oxidoreductase